MGLDREDIEELAELRTTVVQLKESVDRLTRKVDELDRTAAAGKAVLATLLKVGAIGGTLAGIAIAVLNYFRGN